MRDLHIFANLSAYQRFRYCGGEAEAMFRDEGSDLTEALRVIEIRELYLHDGVELNDTEWHTVQARMRNPFCFGMYKVEEMAVPPLKHGPNCDCTENDLVDCGEPGCFGAEIPF